MTRIETDKYTMLLTHSDVDEYIGFVIRCNLTSVDVTKAFSLSTTFSKKDQNYILTFLKKWWK